MNWDRMQKNKGCHVQLVPMACCLDNSGRSLPRIDDDWVITEIVPDGVQITNARTHHQTTLGRDHIHNFTTNPDRSKSGSQHGFLTLHVQIFLQAEKIWVRPNARPGELVDPQPSEVIERWVDIGYPSASGIQQRLEAAGYCVRWSLDTNLSRRIDLEGWEIVIEPDAQGVRTTYRLKDRPADQTLIKKQKSPCS